MSAVRAVSLVLLSGCVGTAVGAFALPSGVAPHDTTETEAEVTAFIDEWETALRAGDSTALTAMTRPSAYVYGSQWEDGPPDVGVTTDVPEPRAAGPSVVMPTAGGVVVYVAQVVDHGDGEDLVLYRLERTLDGLLVAFADRTPRLE
ncbi:hypothetical protein [Aquipuribacter nitratireducens]|uniref:DUF4440 domain-containing protein n=1 Tax=Aquipuribacter nitratireducens TaxID=650104 RepID=A0ABW0GQ48_9MICO